MSIAAWLIEIIKPLVTRILVALGLGTVTYAGAQAAINAVISAIQGSLAGLTGDIAAILAMAGFFESISITTGALTTYVTVAVLKKFTLQTTS